MTYSTLNEIDCWELIKDVPDNYFDAIICDPMYNQPLDTRPLVRICKGNIITFCNPASRYFQPDEILHWIKQPSTKNTTKRMSNFVEEILVLRRGVYNHNLHWSNYIGVFQDLIEGELIHPYQKPLSLMERLVRVYTNPGDVIFDPFAGSGTTLIAARNCGREAVGCENDHETYLKALRRMFP
jgi:DNA modification methylase